MGETVSETIFVSLILVKWQRIEITLKSMDTSDTDARVEFTRGNSKLLGANPSLYVSISNANQMIRPQIASRMFSWTWAIGVKAGSRGSET